jgi:hypothetical protein
VKEGVLTGAKISVKMKKKAMPAVPAAEAAPAVPAE